MFGPIQGPGGRMSANGMGKNRPKVNDSRPISIERRSFKFHRGRLIIVQRRKDGLADFCIADVVAFRAAASVMKG